MKKYIIQINGIDYVIEAHEPPADNSAEDAEPTTYIIKISQKKSKKLNIKEEKWAADIYNPAVASTYRPHTDTAPLNFSTAIKRKELGIAIKTGPNYEFYSIPEYARLCGLEMPQEESQMSDAQLAQLKQILLGSLVNPEMVTIAELPQMAERSTKMMALLSNGNTPDDSSTPEYRAHYRLIQDQNSLLTGLEKHYNPCKIRFIPTVLTKSFEQATNSHGVITFPEKSTCGYFFRDPEIGAIQFMNIGRIDYLQYTNSEARDPAEQLQLLSVQAGFCEIFHVDSNGAIDPLPFKIETWGPDQALLKDILHRTKTQAHIARIIAEAPSRFYDYTAILRLILCASEKKFFKNIWDISQYLQNIADILLWTIQHQTQMPAPRKLNLIQKFESLWDSVILALEFEVEPPHFMQLLDHETTRVFKNNINDLKIKILQSVLIAEDIEERQKLEQFQQDQITGTLSDDAISYINQQLQSHIESCTMAMLQEELRKETQMLIQNASGQAQGPELVKIIARYVKEKKELFSKTQDQTLFTIQLLQRLACQNIYSLDAKTTQTYSECMDTLAQLTQFKQDAPKKIPKKLFESILEELFWAKNFQPCTLADFLKKCQLAISFIPYNSLSKSAHIIDFRLRQILHQISPQYSINALNYYATWFNALCKIKTEQHQFWINQPEYHAFVLQYALELTKQFSPGRLLNNISLMFHTDPVATLPYSFQKQLIQAVQERINDPAIHQNIFKSIQNSKQLLSVLLQSNTSHIGGLQCVALLALYAEFLVRGNQNMIQSIPGFLEHFTTPLTNNDQAHIILVVSLMCLINTPSAAHQTLSLDEIALNILKSRISSFHLFTLNSLLDFIHIMGPLLSEQGPLTQVLTPKACAVIRTYLIETTFFDTALSKLQRENDLLSPEQKVQAIVKLCSVFYLMSCLNQNEHKRLIKIAAILQDEISDIQVKTPTPTSLGTETESLKRLKARIDILNQVLNIIVKLPHLVDNYFDQIDDPETQLEESLHLLKTIYYPEDALVFSSDRVIRLEQHISKCTIDH